MGLEDSKERAVSGLSKPSHVVLAWGGGNGGKMCLVSPGDAVKNSELLRFSFQESHCLIRGDASCPSPGQRRSKLILRECPKKRWKCKHYIT